MTEKPEVVFVQLRAPRGDNDYGLVEEGFFITRANEVILVDAKGVQRTDRKGKPIKQLIPREETARHVAWRLTKANMPNRGSGFNRPLRYFNPGKI